MSIEHDTRKPTLASLQADLDRTVKEQADREKRISDCVVESTDCALSMWAADSMNDKRRMQMRLAQRGWTWGFQVLCRKDERGITVPVKGRKVDTRFGMRWCIDGKWMPSYHAEDTPRRLKNLAKLGYFFQEIELDAHVAQSFGSYIGAPTHAFPMPDDRDIITG